ncbi:MAG: hypothetical protein P8099_14745 [Gemmatimonadota bacterium]|jgi:hypothetical protein
MNDENKSDDLPFLDDLPFTPTPGSEPAEPAPEAPPSEPAEPPVAAPKQQPAAPTPPVATPKQQPAAPPPPAATPTQQPAAPAPQAETPTQPAAAPAQPAAEPTAPAAESTAPAATAEPEPVSHRQRAREAREEERKRAVIPPAVLAHRMQRYSIYLIVAAFLLMALNYDALSLSAVLWFAAGLSAGFAILCAVAVVLLNAIAWNFDRLRDELRGGREVIDLRE